MQVSEGSAAVGQVLVIENVVRSYGPVKAVDGVSLKIKAGELVALLGPNGAGKSTLFQLLSGLFTPDGGRIVIMGHDMAREPIPALAGLGIVFQQPTLDLELTVAGNLRFHAGLHGFSRSDADRRIGEVLARVGLADAAKTKVQNLSGGNRRRVELARALLHEPRILLMDEATVGLDPASRTELLAFIRELRTTRSVAVLWATHLCEEVNGADRVVVMNRGKILKDTTPDELIASMGAKSVEEAFLKLTAPTERAA
jgi:ABC-2 type transport system ATP-binding protein